MLHEYVNGTLSGVAMNYLIVKFYENDYGNPMVSALKRLWTWMDKRNGRLGPPVGGRSLSEMFQELHKAGSLEPMLLRLFILEELCLAVEYATRGLYWKEVDWKIELPPLIPSNYLSCDIEFCETKPKECQNGEYGWLNLVTGEAETY